MQGQDMVDPVFSPAPIVNDQERSGLKYQAHPL